MEQPGARVLYVRQNRMFEDNRKDKYMKNKTKQVKRKKYGEKEKIEQKVKGGGGDSCCLERA